MYIKIYYGYVIVIKNVIFYSVSAYVLAVHNLIEYCDLRIWWFIHNSNIDTLSRWITNIHQFNKQWLNKCITYADTM